MPLKWSSSYNCFTYSRTSQYSSLSPFINNWTQLSIQDYKTQRIGEKHLCKSKMEEGLSLRNVILYYWAANLCAVTFLLDDARPSYVTLFNLLAHLYNVIKAKWEEELGTDISVADWEDSLEYIPTCSINSDIVSYNSRYYTDYTIPKLSCIGYFLIHPLCVMNVMLRRAPSSTDLPYALACMVIGVEFLGSSLKFWRLQ